MSFVPFPSKDVFSTCFPRILNNLTATFSFRKPTILNEELKVKKLSFSYSKNNFVLRDISFSILKGETIGLIGESGSGKSSLVDIIIGLLKPDSGLIEVDGIDIKRNLRSWQNNIGYVSQSIYLTDDSIIRNIALGVDDDQIEDSI